MKFLIQEPHNDQNFILVYRKEDYSFDIEPLVESGDASILINELQLEIDYNGKIMYAWGYCPLINHKETREFPKDYKKHSLLALLDKSVSPGISYVLNEDCRWQVYFNKREGWICLGNPNTKHKQLIEFAPNCIATMEGKEIIAIWLHPERLPE